MFNQVKKFRNLTDAGDQIIQVIRQSHQVDGGIIRLKEERETSGSNFKVVYKKKIKIDPSKTFCAIIIGSCIISWYFRARSQFNRTK